LKGIIGSRNIQRKPLKAGFFESQV